MNAAQLNRLARPASRFGSLSAALGNTSPPEPTLMFLGYSKSGINRITPLYSNGKWHNPKLNFAEEEEVSFHYKFLGDGVTNLFATFSDYGMLINPDTNEAMRDSRGEYTHGTVRQFLFLRPVGAVGHQNNNQGVVSIRMPTNIDNLIFYVSKNIPSDVSQDYVDSNGRTVLTNNIFDTIDQLPTSTIRSPSLSGLSGPPVDHRTISSNEATNTASGGRGEKLWTGDVGNHSWKTHGWSSGQHAGPTYVAAGNRPETCVRGSLYVWREGQYNQFEGNPNLLGWDAWERPTAALPAGVPICFVGQLFNYHKNDDRTFYAPAWYKSKQVTIPAHQFYITPMGSMGLFDHGQRKSSKSVSRKRMHRKDKSNAIPTSITIPTSQDYRGLINPSERVEFHKKGMDGETVTQVHGRPYPLNDLRAFAWKVEWWNDSSKTWTPPQVHPPNGLKTNSSGKVKLIFRLPRQIAKGDPDFAVSANYDISKTWDCYPTVSRAGVDDQGITHYVISFSLIGRPEEAGDRPLSTSAVTIEYAGWNVHGRLTSSTGMFCLEYDTGERGKGDAPPVMSSTDWIVKAADPVKFAYINNPSINNVYWASGEFAPGSTLIVIGQSLGSVLSFAMTKNKDETVNAVNSSVYNIDRVSAMGGTKPHDIFDTVAHITTHDLTQTGVSGNGKVSDAWRVVFEKDLSAEWFKTVAIGGTMPDGTVIGGVKNAHPDDPLYYKINHQGEEHRFPFSIAVIKIRDDWVGPVLDFNTGRDGIISLSENSIKKGEPCYIVAETSLRQFARQQINLDEEIEEQLAALAAGMSPDEALVANDMNHDMVINTEEAVVQTRVREAETGQQTEEAELKGWWPPDIWPFRKRKTVVVNNPIRKYTLIPVGNRKELGGFGMIGAPYVIDDLTDRYSADHETALGGYPAAKRFDIDELYLMQGKPTDANVDWFVNREPEPAPLKVEAPRKQDAIGNLNGRAIHARATKRGDPMTRRTMEVTLINPATLGRPPFRVGASEDN